MGSSVSASMRFLGLGLALRPFQVFVKALKGPNAVDRMRAIKEFDFGAISDSELRIQPAHVGVFVSNPFIRSDPVVMAALDHEWTRRDQGGHFRVIERMP